MFGMSSDAKWVVGAAATLAALIVTASLALAGLILQQSNLLQNRISGIDARLRTVEEVQAQHSVKLDQHSVKLDQHSVKLDQLLGGVRPVETRTLAQSASD